MRRLARRKAGCRNSWREWLAVAVAGRAGAGTYRPHDRLERLRVMRLAPDRTSDPLSPLPGLAVEVNCLWAVPLQDRLAP